MGYMKIGIVSKKSGLKSLRLVEDHSRKARKIGAVTLNLEEHPIQHRKI